MASGRARPRGAAARRGRLPAIALLGSLLLCACGCSREPAREPVVRAEPDPELFDSLAVRVAAGLGAPQGAASAVLLQPGLAGAFVERLRERIGSRGWSVVVTEEAYAAAARAAADGLGFEGVAAVSGAPPVAGYLSVTLRPVGEGIDLTWRFVCGPACGRGEILRYAREGGRWRRR